MRRWLVVLLALFAVRNARAEPPHIVGIETDARLERAVTTALGSWHANVSSVPGPFPGTDLDDAIRTGHRIARETAARVVFWLSKDSLWIYDDGTRAIVVRPLPSAPPYDEETAAAIALTIKTVLRDVLERPPQALALTAEQELPFTPKKPPVIHTVRLAVLGGVRIPTNATDAFNPRFGAEITYFYKGTFGIGAGIDFGLSPLTIQRLPYLTGTSTDTVLVPFELKWRLPVRRWLACELSLGPGAHFGTLQGTAPIANLSGTSSRTDLSLEAAIGLELEWKVLRVAPLVGASLRAHYERYSVDGVQVFDVPTSQVLYALRVGVELP